VAKFLSLEFTKKVPEGNILIFVDTCISLKHSIGLVEKKPPCPKPDFLIKTDL